MTSLFKENRGKARILTKNDMLLMVEKGNKRGICHAVHRSAKANNKYMIKTKNHHIFTFMFNNFYLTICMDA